MIRTRSSARVLTAVVLATATNLSTLPAFAQSPCGPTVDVQSGDTLAAISARCEISERQILGLNPSIDGSEDLLVGQSVALGRVQDAENSGALDRLGAIAGEATRDLAESARRAGEALGSEVDQFLDANPGIGRQVRDLTGGLDGGGEAQLAVSIVEGEGGRRLSLAGAGLPSSERVWVTGGRPGVAQERLAEGRTSSDGTFETSIPLPPKASGGFRIALRGVEGGWKATAALPR